MLLKPSGWITTKEVYGTNMMDRVCFIALSVTVFFQMLWLDKANADLPYSDLRSGRAICAQCTRLLLFMDIRGKWRRNTLLVHKLRQEENTSEHAGDPQCWDFWGNTWNVLPRDITEHVSVYCIQGNFEE